VSVTYFIDPKDRKRSLMLRQKPLCSGAQTGFKCRHYWSTIAKLDSLNITALKNGEKTRRCLVIAPEIIELGDGGHEQAVFCDRYAADHDRPFDPSFEGYNPLSQKEIDALDELDVDDADDADDAAAAADLDTLVSAVEKKADAVYQRTLTVAQVAGIDDPKKV
jgi:hypothetical protein